MMGLIRKILDKIYFTEAIDVVRADVVRRKNGGHSISFEVLRGQDMEKVRKSRVRTEINDVCIPAIEDISKGIVSASVLYRRQVAYLFGLKAADWPVLEDTFEYDNGKIESREVRY